MTIARRSARGLALRVAFGLCAALLFTGFIALGTWQVERRAWKLDLIERVDQRVHAAPVAPPAPEAWAGISKASDEYRHVRLTGHYIAGRDTFVQASTVRGSGFWVLTPLLQPDGSAVLVNRGFVPTPAFLATPGTGGSRDTSVTVDGLLRLTEPGGGFLRSNDPVADRWFSRDVEAIGAARGLTQVAPYFVDAGAAAVEQPGQPVGGLTVIVFANSHLVYAITWYALALMVAGALVLVAMHNAKRHDNERTPAAND